MSVLRRVPCARAALSAAVRTTVSGAALAAVPAVLGVDLLQESSRTLHAARDAARDAARRSVEAGVRTMGTRVTGANPLPTGRLSDLRGVVHGMVEPPGERHTPRVWADHGRVQVELPAQDGPEAAEERRVLRKALEGLDGVDWVAINDVVGRVLVAFDEHRLGPGDVLGVISSVERARIARDGLPEREDHPADIEPLLAALASAAVDTTAAGVAAAAAVLPIPALSRHATVAVVLLENHAWLREWLSRRVGAFGTRLAFESTGAVLHALTQSPAVPALNAASAYLQVLELRARRQLWNRVVDELCDPHRVGDTEPQPAAGDRPAPLPDGPVDRYVARIGPVAATGALVLLALTGQPGRSADLINALSSTPARRGRESFAAALDLLLSGRGVVAMDREAYRRLDRVDTAVVAAVLRGDPYAEALLRAARGAGLRVLLTEQPGTADAVGAAERPPAGEPLWRTVRRLQADGHGVLLVSPTDRAALRAADVAIAPTRPGRAPAWGTDLITAPGLREACRIVGATADARTVGRLSVLTALTGNVVGGALASVAPPDYQRHASLPGKWATGLTMLAGAGRALVVSRRP
jgi:cation-transporting P-type ATPase I